MRETCSVEAGRSARRLDPRYWPIQSVLYAANPSSSVTMLEAPTIEEKCWTSSSVRAAWLPAVGARLLNWRMPYAAHDKRGVCHAAWRPAEGNTRRRTAIISTHASSSCSSFTVNTKGGPSIRYIQYMFLYSLYGSLSRGATAALSTCAFTIAAPFVRINLSQSEG